MNPEVRRRDEAQFWREFEEARPRILGALLDAAVAGLRNLASARPERLPRMADFAILVKACEQGLGIERDEALAGYRANCVEARNLALEASPLYEPIRIVAREGFSGTISELHNRLNVLANVGTRRSNGWPKAPSVLGNLLRRMASNLRSAGNQPRIWSCRAFREAAGHPEHFQGPENTLSAVSAVSILNRPVGHYRPSIAQWVFDRRGCLIRAMLTALTALTAIFEAAKLRQPKEPAPNGLASHHYTRPNLASRTLALEAQIVVSEIDEIGSGDFSMSSLDGGLLGRALVVLN